MNPSRTHSQISLPWRKVLSLAVRSLRVRLIRACITMTSVVLAIAFLTQTLASHEFENGLKRLADPEINARLARNGVDLAAPGLPRKTLCLVGLSLLVASAGIVNAMLMSVTERFREIGTMKCLGAMDGFIIRLFLIEAAVQGLLGAAVGVLAGMLIAAVGAAATYGRIALQAVSGGGLGLTGLAILGVGLALSLVFAVYPAYVAAAMQPVDAMRVEE